MMQCGSSHGPMCAERSTDVEAAAQETARARVQASQSCDIICEGLSASVNPDNTAKYRFNPLPVSAAGVEVASCEPATPPLQLSIALTEAIISAVLEIALRRLKSAPGSAAWLFRTL